MAHLTQIWNDKLNVIKAGQLGQNVDLIGYAWSVQWDHPDFPQGEKVTKERFKTMEEAKDYAISIGLKYDLRLRSGELISMNPNLSRYKSGFSPLPDPHAVQAVWPCIQNKGTWPHELLEPEIQEYCNRTNTHRPQWSLPTGDRDAMKSHPHNDKQRTKAGPL
jgi:hypothetical protein